MVRDSAAIARHGNSLSVEDMQGGGKKNKRDGLDSFAGEFWQLGGATNPNQGGNKTLNTLQEWYRKRKKSAHPSRSGSDRRIE
jgi:hypothetical protein